MFEIYCRCCLTKDRILVSLTTESNHKDNKTLLDYFNIVLTSPVKYLNNTSFICLRCSKALQVAYHFINMTMESEDVLSDYYKHEAVKLMGNPKIMEIQENEKQSSCVVITETDSNLEIRQSNDNLSNFENEFKMHINKMDSKNQNLPAAIKKDLKKTQSKKISYIGVQYSKEMKDFNNAECKICQKQFESKDLLEQHNKIHKEIVPFKCKMCNFYSCFSESLLKHCKINHGLTNVELKLYQTKESYNILTENPHFELTFKCLECDFESFQQSVIDEHLCNEHFIEEDKELFTIKFYNCPACHRSFNGLKSAKIHYTMYHNVSRKKINTMDTKKHGCEKCGKIFLLKSGLLLHRRICEFPDPVNCNFCGLQFSSVLKYEQHLEIKHLIAIKHECEICGKSFKCSDFLKIHRKRHNERYYQCDLCPKNYINNAELKVHKQRRHNRGTQNQCNICGKTFDHLTLLRNHKNKEHLKKCNKCAYCEYISHSKFAIKVHQYKHTGKPYKCKLCTKEFVLRKHIKQHCQQHHSVVITNEELAEMFKQFSGYVSRFDAFSMENNNLKISEINELELEGELKDNFGLTLEDIMEDLFDTEISEVI